MAKLGELGGASLTTVRTVNIFSHFLGKGPPAAPSAPEAPLGCSWAEEIGEPIPSMETTLFYLSVTYITKFILILDRGIIRNFGEIFFLNNKNEVLIKFEFIRFPSYLLKTLQSDTC